MRRVHESDQAIEHWRDGVRTRLIAARTLGSAQLTIFEQWCDPGHGAPLHEHAVEEVLRVLSGTAEFRVGEELATIQAGGGVIIPAGEPHGFRNSGEDILHTEAILAAPLFEVHYLDSDTNQRRWSEPDER